MFHEPPATSADLRFSIAGIPVRVHPLFWLVSLVFGASADSPGVVLMWVGVVFVSILIHELGHALAARAYRAESWIVLYSFGGLAMHAPPVRDWRRRIAIMAAGPLAGFAFAAVLALGIFAAGERVQFEWAPPFGLDWGTSFKEPWLRILFGMLFFVNIYWGLVNLLPIFPLDGGQIARELFLQFGGSEALRQSLWLSVGTAAGFVVYALAYRPGSLFFPLFFGYLAYLSYQELQDYGGGGWR
jgi:membrane-associated protease RseP (regulator of RpoE activity)